MKIAIVGATGLVGREILKVMEEREIYPDDLFLVASEKSVGRKIRFNNQDYSVISMDEAIKQKPDFVLFSAGSGTSLKYAPKFAETGSRVVDNSSAWRMNPAYKLIVPEINADILTEKDRIIANPNCSTIQLLMAVAPLHKAFKLKRMVISTYQSVSGSGYAGMNQLDAEEKGDHVDAPAYNHQIYRNCIPQGGGFDETGYTSEEMKLVHESHKILNDYDIKITSTVVRVPVTGGHSESVNLEFEKDFELSEVYEQLNNMPGVVFLEKQEDYPMPYSSRGKNEVFVGRIRRDFSVKSGLNMWIVADNLRKGAATNAVQIMEYLIGKDKIL